MKNQEIKDELEKILTVSNIIFEEIKDKVKELAGEELKDYLFDSVTEYSRRINNQMYEILPTKELKFDLEVGQWTNEEGLILYHKVPLLDYEEHLQFNFCED